MKSKVLLGLLSVAILANGCASKKYVRKEQETTNRRIDEVAESVEAVESRVKQNEEAIAETQGELSKTKMDVEEAKRIAKGKLLYQVVLNNDAIKFGTNQSELTETGVSAVRDLLQKLKVDNKDVFVEIEGHTDNVGEEKYNYELGLDRAEAVRRFMSSEGLPLHKINVISYGETQPISDNSTPDGRSKNRRVVILVLE